MFSRILRLIITHILITENVCLFTNTIKIKAKQPTELFAGQLLNRFRMFQPLRELHNNWWV